MTDITPSRTDLLAEMKRKLLEAKEHADKIGPQDAEFERLARMNRKALIKELRELRHEIAPEAISKMLKHQLVNEIIRLKFLIEADTHVPHTLEEIADASKKTPKQDRAKLSAKEAGEKAAKPPRKASEMLLKVAAKRKQGMSLKDAWAAVKAEKASPAPTPAPAKNPDHLREIAAHRPKAHLKEEAAATKAKRLAAAKKNPIRARLAELMAKGHSFAEAAAIVNKMK